MPTAADRLGEPSTCRCSAKVYQITLGRESDVPVEETRVTGSDSHLLAVQRVRGCLTGQKITARVARGMDAAHEPVFRRHTACTARPR